MFFPWGSMTVLSKKTNEKQKKKEKIEVFIYLFLFKFSNMVFL